MLYKIASYLATVTICKSCKDESKIPVLVYGYEVLISQVFASTAILLIGLSNNSFLEACTFLVTFISLRLYCGGYHASSYRNCFFSSIFIFIMIMLLKNLVIEMNVFNVCWCFGELASGVIFRNAPVVNINHPISDERSGMNKRKAKKALIVFDLLILLGMLFGYTGKVVITTILSKLMVAVLMQLEILKGRRKNDE